MTRDAAELEEWGTKPANILLADPLAHPVGNVVCLERLSYTTSLISHPSGIRKAYEWGKRWRPRAYVFVIRPGLPLWLFWLWQRRGVPTIGVVAHKQLDQVHWATAMMRDAAELCTVVEERGTNEERDEFARSQGSVVTIEHIMQGLAPDA